MSANTATLELRKRRMNGKEDAAPGAAAWRRRVAALALETNRAFLIAYRVTISRALAEEAVQDAFVRMLEHPLEDQGPEKASAYLLKTVHSSAINLLVSASARKLREEKHAMSLPQTTPSPDQEANHSELAHAARAALDGLHQEERVAVSLCCEMGLTRIKAAEVLEIPERTISSRVERGLARLRSLLAAQGFASAAPLALAQALQSLELPAAPGALTQAIGKLTVMHSGMEAASASVSSLAAKKVVLGAGAKWIVALSVVASTGAGAIWWTVQHPQREAIPEMAGTQEKLPSVQPASVIPLPPTSPKTPETKSARLVFHSEFEALPAGEESPNPLARLREAGKEITAIVSRPRPTGRTGWNPEASIEFGGATSGDGKELPLFSIPKSVEYRIRIKSERAGKFDISQSPAKRTFSNEHFKACNFEVGTEWREVILHAADITPYRTEGPTRDFIPGVEIQRIGIYSFGAGKLFVDRFEVFSLAQNGINP